MQAKWLACFDDIVLRGASVFVTDVPKPERAPLTQILQYRSLVDRKDPPSIKRIPTVGKRRLIEKTCALIRPFSIQRPNFEVLENCHCSKDDNVTVGGPVIARDWRQRLGRISP